MVLLDSQQQTFTRPDAVWWAKACHADGPPLHVHAPSIYCWFAEPVRRTHVKQWSTACACTANID
jgi:hypothetical protein